MGERPCHSRPLPGASRGIPADLLEKGSIQNLTDNERATIKGILEFYGPKDAWYLSELTHRELPWKEARAGLSPGSRGSSEISQASMAEYYGSLV